MYTELFEAMMKVLNGADFRNRDNHLELMVAIHHIAAALADEHSTLRKLKVSAGEYSVLLDFLIRIYDRLPYDVRLSHSIYVGLDVRGDQRYIEAFKDKKADGKVDMVVPPLTD